MSCPTIEVVCWRMHLSTTNLQQRVLPQNFGVGRTCAMTQAPTMQETSTSVEVRWKNEKHLSELMQAQSDVLTYPCSTFYLGIPLSRSGQWHRPQVPAQKEGRSIHVGNSRGMLKYRRTSCSPCARPISLDKTAYCLRYRRTPLPL